MQKLLFLISWLILSHSIVNAQGCNITISKKTFCRNSPITFSIPSTTTFAAIKWDFGDGDSSVIYSNQANHAYDTFGNFQVCVFLYDASGGLKCSNCTTVRIFDNPNVKIQSLDSAFQCLDSNYFCFKDISTHGRDNAPIVKRIWEMGDGTSYNNLSDVCHTYSLSGNYQITFAITDSNGCSQVFENRDFIKVIGVKADFIDTNSKPYICAPKLIGFKDLSIGLNDYKYIYKTNGTIKDSVKIDSVNSWSWNFGDNLGSLSKSVIKNPYHTYKTNGVYDVSLIVNTVHGCIDTIKKQGFIEVDGPQPKFWILNSGNPSTFGYADHGIIKVIDSSKYMNTWYFLKGDGTEQVFKSRPNDHIFSITYNTPGAFNLILKGSEWAITPVPYDTIPCIQIYGDKDNPNDPNMWVYVDSSLSIKEEIPNSISVYPNPAKDKISIEFERPLKQAATIELYNLLGEKVFSLSNVHNIKTEINVNSYSEGIYIIKIETEGVIFTEKVVLIE